MRFAILTNAFPPDGQGGAERSAFLQADALACLGHDVRVWAPDKGVGSRGVASGIEQTHRKDFERTVVHGMEVFRFPSQLHELKNHAPLSLFRLWFHLIGDAGARKDIVDSITAWKPDVLFTHNLTGCGIGTARAIQSHKVKWIHTLHDVQLTDLKSVGWSQSSFAAAWRAVWSFRRKLVFGTPDVLVSPTQWLLDWHIRAGFSAQRTAIIPNAVEIGPARERTLHRPATIAYVGRLSKEKGFGLFLDVIKDLDRSLVSKIVVVGGGSMMPQAERMYDPRIILRGALSFEDARRIIGEADLLIAPSQILENQQTILLEAMAEGTPVVATDVGGTKETLEGTGCLVASPQHLSDAAAHLLSNPDEWQRISRTMRARAEERHDKEKYFDALAKLF
jgi:glycosyltransferase involved in cell wall biosynthesis